MYRKLWGSLKYYWKEKKSTRSVAKLVQKHGEGCSSSGSLVGLVVNKSHACYLLGGAG